MRTIADFDLGTARGKVEIDSSGAEKGFRKASDAADTTFGKLEASSGAMLKVGGALAGMGVGLAAGVGVAIKASADFEKEISNFQAAAQETPEVLEEIRQKALQIGRDTSFGAGEAAGAITALSYAGLEADEILGGAADAAIALAEAGGIDVADAAKLAAAGLNTFQLEASELDRVANSMIGTFANSPTSVAALGQALEQVGATAATLNIPIEEVNTALGMLAGRGIEGGKAGTTLNRMLLSLQPTTEGAATAMSDLGLITEDGQNQFFNAAGELKSLDEVSQLLQTSLAGLTDEQRVSTLETIFGSRAISAASALAEGGAAGFNELAEAISEVDAGDVAAEKLDNLGGAMTILKGTIETALISAGSPFQDALKGIVQGLTGIINAFASMDPRFQKFLVFAAAGLAAVLLAAGGFLIFAGTAIKVVRTIKDLGPALKVVKAGFLIAKGAAAKFFAVLMANPIILIIAAIAALAYIIYRNWDTIVAFLKNAWKAIQGAAGSALDWIKDTVSGVIDWIKSNWPLILAIFTGPFGLLVLFISRNWDKIKALFSLGLEWIKTTASNIWTGITGAFSRGIDAIVTFFQELPGRIVSFLTALPGLVAYWLGFVIGRIIRWAIDGTKAVVKFGVDFISAVISFLKDLPGKINTWLTKAGLVIAAWIVTSVKQAYEMASNFVSTIVDFLSSLPGKVVKWFTVMLAKTIFFKDKMIHWAKTTGRKFVESVVQFIKELPGKIYRFIADTIQKVTDAVPRIARQARDFALGMFNGIKNILRDLPGMVGDMVMNAIDALKDFAGRAWRAAKDIGSNLWEGFKEGLGISSPSFLERAMFQIVDTIDNETGRLAKQVKGIQKLAEGVVSDSTIRAMVETPTLEGSARMLVGASGASLEGDSRGDDGPSLTFERVEINNPIPEATEETVPRLLRKMAYLGWR